MQQQLAKLQVALEQTHADFNGLGEGRARAELDADAAKRRYAELKGVGDALSKRLIKNEAELNSLQDTLRQVNTIIRVALEYAETVHIRTSLSLCEAGPAGHALQTCTDIPFDMGNVVDLQYKWRFRGAHTIFSLGYLDGR